MELPAVPLALIMPLAAVPDVILPEEREDPPTDDVVVLFKEKELLDEVPMVPFILLTDDDDEPVVICAITGNAKLRLAATAAIESALFIGNWVNNK
ncbi:MAG: hypothetical protein JWM56_643 [Candidatus Peribacteria bacterium]|nr:hypothetical protein [Candidatus Peribacteria bacterium]